MYEKVSNNYLPGRIKGGRVALTTTLVANLDNLGDHHRSSLARKIAGCPSITPLDSSKAQEVCPWAKRESNLVTASATPTRNDDRIMSSVFGKIFCISTFGESHGGGVGAVIDGCPPRLALGPSDIQPQLDRRRPGQSALTTDRQEPDRVEILSGVENGQTLGTPITLLVRNQDQRPGDYADLAGIPRPSHADYTYQQKYGIRSASGGGRASARETVARVAAGAVAEKLLAQEFGVSKQVADSAFSILSKEGLIEKQQV